MSNLAMCFCLEGGVDVLLSFIRYDKYELLDLCGQIIAEVT